MTKDEILWKTEVGQNGLSSVTRWESNIECTDAIPDEHDVQKFDLYSSIVRIDRLLVSVVRQVTTTTSTARKARSTQKQPKWLHWQIERAKTQVKRNEKQCKNNANNVGYNTASSRNLSFPSLRQDLSISL